MDDFTVVLDSAAARIARAARIADRCAVAEIECEGIAETIDGARWYDIRLMLDEREHAPESIDIAREVIDYALERRLVKRHPVHSHLLRVVSQ